MKNLLFKILISIIILISINSCNLFKDPLEPENNSYKIEFGAFTQVGSSSISPTGGTLVVKNGSSIDGLTITVPSKGLSTTKQFIVSTAELINKEIGENLNPISPVIKIENGGGYADGIIKIKIPIKLPSGHFPMGYFIDQTTNKLEPIPIIDFDETSITLGTRHFSSSTINQSSSIKNMRTKAGESYSNMIISSIAESVLNSQTIISSGFTPGVDDWEFVNFGSYISPGGHCAGQSMTAMWYFYEKKLKGGSPLFHQYDKFNTKTDPTILWQDNPFGYRFASVIQEDFNWTNWVNDMDFRSKYPSIVWKAFAAGMLVTGEPQNVLIRNSAGNGGHAMIVHKINFAEGKLYISDPNYPNNIDPWAKTNTIRTIDYANEAFKPYSTGLSANSLGSISMDQISYFGKTAYIDWEKIGKRWDEVVSKKIGTVSPNNFPEYTLWNNDIKLTEIKDSITVSKDTLKLVALSEQTANWYSNKLQGKKVIGLYIFDENGNQLLKQDGTLKKFILLKSGVNKLGIYVYAWRNNDINKELYIDFKWITINYEKQAKFEYWLKSENTESWGGHFGQIADEESDVYGFPGSWVGNTYVINKILTIEGVSVDVKFTSTFNSDKTIMTSYKLDEKFNFEGESVRSTIEGSNLPKTATTSEYFVYGANGVSTCNYISNVYFNIFIDVEKYGCDDETFIKFRIPKP